jgi:hypothetical protein
MIRNSQAFFTVLALAILVSQSGYAQDKAWEPRIELKLEKPASGGNPAGLLEPFGMSCKSRKQEAGRYRALDNGGLDKPTSIAELMGARINALKIRRYGPGWKKPDDVRKHLATLLKTQTREVYLYEPWDEAAFADIIATVQFSDHTEGTLEASGVHVCFSDHSGSALWLRGFPAK